jgi:hypothetical protein
MSARNAKEKVIVRKGCPPKGEKGQTYPIRFTVPLLGVFQIMGIESVDMLFGAFPASRSINAGRFR